MSADTTPDWSHHDFTADETMAARILREAGIDAGEPIEYLDVVRLCASVLAAAREHALSDPEAAREQQRAMVSH